MSNQAPPTISSVARGLTFALYLKNVKLIDSEYINILNELAY